MNDTAGLRLPPVEWLDDDQLRQELADAHRVDQALSGRFGSEQRAALQSRLAELDHEYLRRFPQATARWPWPRTGAGS